MGSSKSGVFGVRVGRQVGIFDTWDECRSSVTGYPYAEYKKFPTREDAEVWVYGEARSMQVKSAKTVGFAPMTERFDSNATDNTGETRVTTSDLATIGRNLTPTECVAFVDGSYDNATKTFGYGCLMYTDSTKYTLSGADRQDEIAQLRNVAGEIIAAIVALQKAIELGMSKITIYYDYEGIGKWVSGEWMARTSFTNMYREFCMAVKKSGIDVVLFKVQGHSNNEGNNIADRLAYKAVKSGQRCDLSLPLMQAREYATKVFSPITVGV